MTINYNPGIVTNGLVLCLDAGNPRSYSGSGTSWFDVSGNGAIGTLTNGVTYSSSNSGVLTFDGVDDRVNVVNSIPSLSNLTIELFLRTAVVDGTQNIFLDQFLSLRYEISTGNKFNIHLGNGSAWAYTFLPSTTTVVANTWYHTAWTWNGSTAVMYVNGVAENSISNAAASSSTGLITLGQHTPDTAYAWAGNMGSVKIYNQGLTAAQVLQNFNAQRGRYGI
jgi:hypothetical protein